MSKNLVWQETKQPGGAKVVFRGPPASPMRVWLGVSAIVMAASLVYLTYAPAHPKPITKEALVHVIPVVLGIAGLSLIIGQFPGVCAGTLEVDRARIHVVPAASWRLEYQVPVVEVDHVSAETEEDESGQGRFRVYAMTRTSGRKTLAMFSDADAALFMAQRLEALVERARSFRG